MLPESMDFWAMDYSLWTFVALWFTAFFAGFVDSIAGGGGIITIPMFLAIGIPAHQALGTNKLQASFGSLTASIHYSRGKLVDVKQTVEGVIFTAIGAAAGTITIQFVSADFLGRIIPIMLAVIFLYMLFSPKLGTSDRKPTMHTFLFYVSMGLALGFYDGAFGPGTGSFWMVAFVTFLGYNMKKANAYTKVMNFTSNIVALTAFIIGGNVLFAIGLVMATGQILGATIGSHLVMKRGVKFVRVFFLTVVAVTIAKLIYSTYIAP